MGTCSCRLCPHLPAPLPRQSLVLLLFGAPLPLLCFYNFPLCESGPGCALGKVFLTAERVGCSQSPLLRWGAQGWPPPSQILEQLYPSSSTPPSPSQCHSQLVQLSHCLLLSADGAAPSIPLMSLLLVPGLPLSGALSLSDTLQNLSYGCLAAWMQVGQVQCTGGTSQPCTWLPPPFILDVPP